MQRTKAPFRADEVGSLLRPPRIKEARARLQKGEIAADDLRKVEDMEIEKVVHKQASTGLRLAMLDHAPVRDRQGARMGTATAPLTR